LGTYALTRGPVWPSALELSERCLATLRAAGYDAAGAARAYVAFSTLVIASAGQDTPTSADGSTVRDQRRASLDERLEALRDAEATYPHRASSTPALRSLSADDHFTYALGRLLDGFRRELGTRN
jgi:hypothetical protein